MARHNKLNEKQLGLLKLVYKFRFVTVNLIARHKGLSRAAVHHALSTLEKQDLLSSRYKPNYRIQRKSATYYLTTEGLDKLKDIVPLHEKPVHAIYHNQRVGDKFIGDRLTLFQIYLALKDTYPGSFNMFTQTETPTFDYLPDPKPNLYLSRRQLSSKLPNDYLLEYLTDNRLWVLRNKLEAYIDHFDSGKWNISEGLPTVLLVCQDVSSERRALKYLDSRLVDFDVLVTTQKALINSTSAAKAIWSDAPEPDELQSLA